MVKRPELSEMVRRQEVVRNRWVGRLVNISYLKAVNVDGLITEMRPSHLHLRGKGGDLIIPMAAIREMTGRR